MTAWYRTGTVSITNGTPNVVGDTTAFTNQVLPGDSITFDAGAKWYEVLSVTDNTHLTLATNFAETTVAGGAFAIQRNSPGWSVPAELATRIGALLAGTAWQTMPDGTAAAPSVAFQSDPDTGLYSAGANLIGIAAAGALVGVIGAAGLILGHTSALASDAVSTTPAIQAHGVTSSKAGLMLGVWVNDNANIPSISIAKSRGAAIGTHTIVQADDLLGQIAFRGSDGTNFIAAAAIRAYVDGTPGTNDMPGRMLFLTTSDGSASLTERARINSSALTLAVDLALGSGGVIGFNSADVALTHSADTLTMTGGVFVHRYTSAARFVNTTDSAGVQALRIETDRATPAANDFVFASFYASSSTGVQTEIARTVGLASSVTNGSMTGALIWATMTSGTISNRLFLDSSGLTPATNDGLPLGTSSSQFSDLFLATGGVINWAASDVTITHAANSLSFGGASNGYVFDSQVLVASNIIPFSNDVGALGTTGNQWSDLHLAEGGVINWDNGDATIAQAGNDITIAGITTLQLSLGGTAVAKLGSTSNYNVFSLNNSIALNGSLGIFGGASGDAATLYLSAPTDIRAYIGGADSHRISATSIGSRNNLATPAAASAIAGFTMGSALVGWYWGTGTPNAVVTAPKGSFYTQTDATTTTSRLWINTNGGTAWANFTTSA